MLLAMLMDTLLSISSVLVCVFSSLDGICLIVSRGLLESWRRCLDWLACSVFCKFLCWSVNLLSCTRTECVAMVNAAAVLALLKVLIPLVAVCVYPL